MAGNATAVGLPVDRAGGRQTGAQESRRDFIDELSRHLGLVPQQDGRRHGPRIRGLQTVPQGGALALDVMGVNDHSDPLPREAEGRPHLLGPMAEDQDDLVQAGGGSGLQRMLEKGLAIQRQELLEPAQACRGAGSQDDAGKEGPLLSRVEGLGGLR